MYRFSTQIKHTRKPKTQEHCISNMCKTKHTHTYIHIYLHTSKYIHIYKCVTKQVNMYRVAKNHRLYLYRSFSAKEPLN